MVRPDYRRGDISNHTHRLVTNRNFAPDFSFPHFFILILLYDVRRRIFDLFDDVD